MLSVAGFGWLVVAGPQDAKTGSTGMEAQGKAHATQATFCPSALNNTRIPPANIPYRCVVRDSSMLVSDQILAFLCASRLLSSVLTWLTYSGR